MPLKDGWLFLRCTSKTQLLQLQLRPCLTPIKKSCFWNFSKNLIQVLFQNTKLVQNKESLKHSRKKLLFSKLQNLLLNNSYWPNIENTWVLVLQLLQLQLLLPRPKFLRTNWRLFKLNNYWVPPLLQLLLQVPALQDIPTLNWKLCWPKWMLISFFSEIIIF